MMNKVQFQKYLQQFRQKRIKVPDRRLMHPLRDWLIGLMVCVILLFVGAGYAVNQFLKYDNLESSIEPIHVSSLRYNQIDAEVAQSVYEERAKNFSILLDPVVSEFNSDAEVPTDDPIKNDGLATSTVSAIQEILGGQGEEDIDTDVLLDEDFAPTSF